MEVFIKMHVSDFNKVVYLIEVAGLIRIVASFGNYYESCSGDMGFPLRVMRLNKHSPIS